MEDTLKELESLRATIKAYKYAGDTPGLSPDELDTELRTRQEAIERLRVELAILKTENAELSQAVARLTGERDALQRKVKAFEVLSGSPKGMLEFCQANGLEHMKPQPTMDTWRKSIVEWANQ